MSFTVAIIGRPNVGKSTLFNRLVGKRVAIVDDTPGVTRDRREGDGRLADLRFRLVDTAGLEDANDDSLEARMRAQTETAFDEADVALFVYDARAGITPIDKHFAQWLRKRKTPVVLVANKCEGHAAQAGLFEAFELGMGEPIAISAEHGEGLSELYDALRPFSEAQPLDAPKTDTPDAQAPLLNISLANEDGEEIDAPEDDNRPLQMAVVGRPNVGKSTLINRLLGEERMLTGPEAGITRDAITVPLHHDGREIQLVDTAGLRRRAKVNEKIEGLSGGETMRAIRFAQLVVLVLDARDMLEKQDLTIARKVIDEGRALVICVNKWDLIEDRPEAMQKLRDRLETSFPQARGIPVITLSAKTGRGVDALLPAVMKLYKIWNIRIGTGPLNRWLEAMTEQHPPPLSQGRRIRLRYITQAKTRPPTFAVFVSRPVDLPESYLRYLANALRDDFKLPGTPLRILTRKGKNPYAPKA